MGGKAPEKVDVVIVGGGLAGLTCGVGLSSQGLKVLVVESAPHLGGRAASWADRVTGDTVPVGPHILLSTYPNMLKLLSMIGTEDQVSWGRPGHGITLVQGQQKTDYKVSQLTPPLHLLPAALTDDVSTLHDILSNVPIMLEALRLSEEDILELDNIDALTHLRSVGVTQNSIDHHWAFTAMAIMNVPLESCSAGALLRLFRRMIGENDVRIGFPKTGLGDLYAPAAKTYIKDRGGEVRTGTAIAGIKTDGVRATGVTLDDGGEIDARACVASVPPQVLKKLIPADWMSHAPFRMLDHFEPCPYVSVYLWFETKITDLDFWARAYAPDDLNLDFHALSNLYDGPDDAPSLIGSNIIYSHRIEAMSDEDIISATLAELAEFLPHAAEAKLRHASLHRTPMAICCPSPGTESKRPEVRSPIAQFFLAGDWVNTRLPYSMESAVASGWLAAEEVLSDFGRPTQLAHAHQDLRGLAQILEPILRMLMPRPGSP